MTIYTTLRASDYANGTSLATVAGWTISGGPFTAQNGDWVGSGTAYYNTGIANHLGFADMRDVDPSNGTIIVPMAVAGANYPNVYFLQWVLHSDGPVLTFYDNNGGYTSSIRFPTGVSNSPRIGWAINGNQIATTVNGKNIADYLNAGQATDLGGVWPTSGGVYQNTRTIPPAYVGGTYAGMLSLGGSNPSYIQLRDAGDVLLITGVSFQRASPTQQRAVVTFTSNVTGATHVGVSVLDATGATIVAEQSVAISAGTYTTAAIPSTAEGGNITLHACTLDGTASDTNDFSLYLPRTIVAAPVSYGQNMDALAYYKSTSAFRDMTKAFNWRAPGNGSVIPDWADVITGTKATDAGFSANLLPINFKGQSQITCPIPYQLDPEWVGVDTVLTSPPGMMFQINNDPGAHLTLHVDTGQHIARFDTAICNGRSISIIQNPALSGSTTQPYGLPTTDWTAQFSWRLASDTHPELHLNDSFCQWWGSSGLSHIRFMKPTNAEEAGFVRGAIVPATRWTNAHRAKLTDAMWTITYLSDMPVEVLVELCNRANKSMWYTFPRGCQEDYVRGFTAYVRDNLASGLKFIVERSNETWDSSYPCYEGYAYDGLQAGLGKPTATFGGSNGSYWPDRDAGGPNGFPGSYIPHNSPYDAAWASYNGNQVDPYPPVAYTVGQYAQSVDSSFYVCTANVPVPASLYTGTIPKFSDYSNSNDYYSALASYLSNRANFYRTSNVPEADSAHWAIFQSYTLARQRAHVVEHQSMVSWVKDEMGAQASRVQSAVNVFNLDIAQDGGLTLENYLVWAATPGATLNPHVDHFTTGSYFLAFKYDYNSAPSSVKNAAPGTARQNAMIADTTGNEVATIVALHQTNAQKLLDFSNGSNSAGKTLSPKPTLGIYEGGTNWQFANWPDAGTLAYHNDVTAMVYTRTGEILGPMYAQLGDGEGGLITAFNDFYPYTLYNTYPNTQGALVWGYSDGVGDVTSSPYVALRDVSLARGGSLVDASPGSAGSGGGSFAFFCVVTTQFYRR